MKTEPTTAPRLIALYARVSTDRQVEEGVSLEAQVEALREWAEREFPGLQTQLYREAGASARSTRRPEFERLRADIAAGNIRAVVAPKSDRLARNTMDTLAFLNECRQRGTEVHTLSGGKMEATPQAELNSTVLAAIAQFESDLRSQRVRESFEFTRSKGLYPTGRPPWGYERGADRILRPSADAHLIRRAFEMFGREGASLAEVERFLDGSRRRFRKRMELDYVSKMVRNAVYAGYITADTRTGDPRLIEGEHEALCPRELWEIVQERLRSNEETGFRGRRFQPFGSVIRCGSCFGPLRHSSDGQGRSYISCNGNCGLKAIPNEQLQLGVIAYLQTTAIWLREELASDGWRVVMGSDTDAEEAREKLLRVESAREQIRAALRAGLLSADEAHDDLARLNAQRDELRPIYESLTRDEDKVRRDLERLHVALRFGWSDEQGAALRWWTTTLFDKRIEDLGKIVKRMWLGNQALGIAYRYGLDRPIVVPLPQVRQTKALAARLQEMGFGSAVREETAAELPSPWRARSAGRSRIPPSVGPRGRG